MKILQINSVCGIGSTGRICTDIADVLRVQGHDCKIAYGRKAVPEEYRDIALRIGADFDIQAHGALSRCLDAHGLGSRRATKRFLSWVENYGPDLIHLHNLHGYYINIKALFDYLKGSKKPVVWTLHDCWAFTGHCAYFDAVRCERWKTGCSACPQKGQYPKAWIDLSAANWEHKRQWFLGMENLRLVTPSRWLAGLVRQSLLGKYLVDVIPNGIDLDIFRPTPSNFRAVHGLKGKRIVLGVANVWHERKGLEDLLKLTSLLDDRYRMVLVGLNEQQRKSLPKSVLGIARTNSTRELAEIYTAADVFVNPSVEETMGLTTAEALSCGTPVVIYDRTAAPEVPDEKCGIVVEGGDISALADAVRSMDFTQENCLLRARQFDKAARYNQYLDLYRNRLTTYKEDRLCGFCS